MMKITDNLINEYLDDRLDASRMEKFEEAVRHDSKAGEKLEHARLLHFALRSSAPAVPSERMLKGIHRRLHAVDPGAFAGPGFWERLGLTGQGPVVLKWGMGMAIVALVLVNVIGERPPASKPAGETVAAESSQKNLQVAQAPAAPAQALAKAAQAPEREKESRTMSTQAIPVRPSVARALVAAPLKKSAPRTEVERALAGGDMNKVIAALLDAQMKKEGRARSMVTVSNSNSAMGATMVNAPAGFEEMRSETSAGRPMGNVDQHGFWNWTSAAQAMNRRDWPGALAEFDNARREAPASGERSFAASARLSIHMLQGQDDALKLGDLRQFPGLQLVVLGAEGWRIFVPQRKAWFRGKVDSRLAGFRSTGDGFTYDLAFDRGEFSPGTRFTRMAGELASPAFKEDGSDLNDNIFVAPRGAEFNFATGELRLK